MGRPGRPRRDRGCGCTCTCSCGSCERVGVSARARGRRWQRCRGIVGREAAESKGWGERSRTHLSPAGGGRGGQWTSRRTAGRRVETPHGEGGRVGGGGRGERRRRRRRGEAATHRLWTSACAALCRSSSWSRLCAGAAAACPCAWRGLLSPRRSRCRERGRGARSRRRGRTRTSSRRRQSRPCRGWGGGAGGAAAAAERGRETSERGSVREAVAGSGPPAAGEGHHGPPSPRSLRVARVKPGCAAQLHWCCPACLRCAEARAGGGEKRRGLPV